MGDFLNRIGNSIPGIDGIQQNVDGVSNGTVAGVMVIVVLVIGLVNCFFGLKIVRVWSALIGLIIGFLAGYVAAGVLELDTTVQLIIALVLGVVFAALGAFWYRCGAFFVCFVFGTALAMNIFNSDELILILICVGIGLVLALVAQFFLAPLIILVTGIHGGLVAGDSIAVIAGFGIAWLGLAIGVALAVIGVIVQFAMEAHRKTKKNTAKAEAIRRQESAENDVERARSIIETLPPDPEAEDEEEEWDETEDDDIVFLDDEDDYK